jgi:hypothetical protein
VGSRLSAAPEKLRLSQPVNTALVDFRAATLNENHQHNDEQYTSYNLNDRGRIHEFLLLLFGTEQF